MYHGPLIYKDATRNSQVYHWCSIYIDISIAFSNCYSFENNIDMRILMGERENLTFAIETVSYTHLTLPTTPYV